MSVPALIVKRWLVKFASPIWGGNYEEEPSSYEEHEPRVCRSLQEAFYRAGCLSEFGYDRVRIVAIVGEP